MVNPSDYDGEETGIDRGSDPDDARLKRNIDWFLAWETDHQEATALAERDWDYYDGKQWTAEEQAILRERGQPDLVFNRTFKRINQMIGTEIKTRVDPNALARTIEHQDDANLATDAIRYVLDANRYKSKIKPAVTKPYFIAGVCGAVVYAEKGQTGFDVKIRTYRWNRLYWDTHSAEEDFSDAKYMGGFPWMDLQDALEDDR